MDGMKWRGVEGGLDGMGMGWWRKLDMHALRGGIYRVLGVKRDGLSAE